MKHKDTHCRHHAQPSQPHPARFRPKQTLLALVAVFLLPMLLAWLTLSLGWFTSGVNNHGEWVQGQVAEDTRWRLILPISPDCDACLKTEPLLNNIVTALGRDGDRVTVIQLPTSNELAAGYIYIADPPGLLIMRYALPNAQSSGEPAVDNEQAKMGKALLTDLRRLLKYSRAG